MAVARLSGSAEPGASVNVAPGEEKSLCVLGCVRERERGRKGALDRGMGRGPVCLLEAWWKGRGVVG